jgi:hypothetical protein
LSALFSMSYRKLCRSEIVEYRGGDGIRGIVDAMRHPKQIRDLQKQGCRLLGRLTDCPDAKRVVAEQCGLVALAEIILKYTDDDEMQESALYAMNRFSKLACLTHRYEVNEATVESLEGLHSILGNLCEPNARSRVQKEALSALFSISHSKLCRREIVEYCGGDGIRGIVDAMRLSKDNRDLQKQGCRLLGRLIDCPDAKRVVTEQCGLVALAETILKYPDDDEMQEPALCAMNCFYIS